MQTKPLLAAVEPKKTNYMRKSLLFWTSVCFVHGDSVTFWLIWKSFKIDDAPHEEEEEEEAAELSCMCLRIHVLLVWECEPKLPVEYLLAGVSACRTICSCRCGWRSENKSKWLLTKTRNPRKALFFMRGRFGALLGFFFWRRLWLFRLLAPPPNSDGKICCGARGKSSTAASKSRHIPLLLGCFWPANCQDGCRGDKIQTPGRTFRRLVLVRSKNVCFKIRQMRSSPQD